MASAPPPVSPPKRGTAALKPAAVCRAMTSTGGRPSPCPKVKGCTGSCAVEHTAGGDDHAAAPAAGNKAGASCCGWVVPNGRRGAHGSRRRRGIIQRIRAHRCRATLEAADECSSDAEEGLRAVVFLRRLVGVDLTLRGDLVVDALQEPGQGGAVVRVHATHDREFPVKVPQLLHAQACVATNRVRTAVKRSSS